MQIMKQYTPFNSVQLSLFLFLLKKKSKPGNIPTDIMNRIIEEFLKVRYTF